MMREPFYEFRHLQGKDVENLRQKTVDQVIGQLLVVIPPHRPADPGCHAVHHLIHQKIAHPQAP